MAMIQMPAQAQQAQNPNTAGGPLPSGVTPEFTMQDKVFLSFSPNPIGKGQTLLVNVWTIPAPAANRAHTGYTVTFTKPDGTTDVIGPFNSFVADGTNWFNYIPDQAGNWTVQLKYPGDYYPAGRYVNGVLNNSAPAGSSFMDQRDYPSTYYTPSETPKQALVVQDQPVMSWYSPLPNNYWTRPISPENREWASIGGNFPYAYYNSYTRDCGPFITGPNTAHIVYRQQRAVAGIIGGEAGQYSIQSSPSTPSVIYLGRCYQTLTVPLNGVPTSCAVCYDLRTGQQYYSIPVSQGGITPTSISYIAPSTSSAQALGTSASGFTVDLISITSGRLYKVDPFTGSITLNASIAPVTAGVFYNNNYALSVQTIATGQYRLLNWTTAGSSTNFASRIVNNITWPVSTAPGAQGLIADFDTGVAVGTVAGIFGSVSNGSAVTGDFGLAAGAYGTRIAGISLLTGQVLYNFTTDLTSFNPGSNSVGYGKIFIPMDMGYLDCYDLITGKLVWRSSEFDYPWGAFGSYNAECAYGLYYWQTYDGEVAFNVTTGQRAWKFQTPASAFETPYTMPNGTSQHSFFGSAMVADGKLYTYNTEHTPSQPITRGWGLYCINATSGQGIWNITGPMQPGAIADGYLTAGNSYDGYMYVFGKGQSSTTISAPQTEVVAGHNAVISGTVLDQSPGQQGTPCVSTQSMGEWMAYLHMQHQMPAIVNGVPVSIDAIDPNNNAVHLATVTTDASGTFGYVWTPSTAGQYKITATFAGDDSYGTSWSQTYASVVQPTTTPTQAPITTAAETVSNSDIVTYIVVGIIAVIIAIAIVGVLLLRKKA